ncbi:alcohol dehydrogenase catalytic domain-containing protein [Peribacillus sp. YIM B13472]|uniref:alcohol dehydrogenase catalytic domain-containing protein n=1 Tax=Peribacillus sp. YIM B13472 TaxID=3366297 RepID=UPI00366B445D
MVKVTNSAICGSDLSLIHQRFKKTTDYVRCHKPMGAVEEVGLGINKILYKK